MNEKKQRQIGYFRMTGLSKRKGFTLVHLPDGNDIFWATSSMPQDQFDTLFASVDWDYPYVAKCVFD
jgi:hypothetical protein